MTARETPPAPSPLVLTAAALAATVGAASILGFVFGLARRADLPDIVVYSGVLAGIVEIALARPLLQRRRAAWSFLTALEGTVALVTLFVVPRMIRGGALGWIGVALFAVHLGLVIVLASRAREFASAQA